MLLVFKTIFWIMRIIFIIIVTVLLLYIDVPLYFFFILITHFFFLIFFNIIMSALITIFLVTTALWYVTILILSILEYVIVYYLFYILFYFIFYGICWSDNYEHAWWFSISQRHLFSIFFGVFGVIHLAYLKLSLDISSFYEILHLLLLMSPILYSSVCSILFIIIVIPLSYILFNLLLRCLRFFLNFLYSKLLGDSREWFMDDVLGLTLLIMFILYFMLYILFGIQFIVDCGFVLDTILDNFNFIEILFKWVIANGYN